MSPLLPRLTKNGPETEKEDFKTDLLNYLSSYNLSQVEKIKEELENFDFSQVKVRLVASIPGNGLLTLIDTFPDPLAGPIYGKFIQSKFMRNFEKKNWMSFPRFAKKGNRATSVYFSGFYENTYLGFNVWLAVF